jgi:peptide/nickel transport system substrate-binding protein
MSDGLTRRELLARALAAGVTVGTSGLLTDPAAAALLAAGAPRRGGHLRVGMVGGGNAETFTPGFGATLIDAERFFNVYDPLTRINPDLTTSPGLALDWIPNKTGTVWEIRLRSGVTWHDGKPFTADDVIYSFRYMAKKGNAAAPSVAQMRLKDLKRVNAHLVRVPLTLPNARLSDLFQNYNTVIIQNGTKSFAKPIGTGAFVFESFTPGQRSLTSRNPSYWEHGKPYVDDLEIISIDDDTARLNALLSGQIDVMAQLPYALAKTQAASGAVKVLDAKRSTDTQVFYMAVDKPPFTDVRVRQAMRLIVDRPAMVAAALDGYGNVANDIVGRGLPFYDAALPQRHQDIDKAKFLLKQAGQQNLHVTLHTSPIVSGFVESATLFAAQAKKAGVNVNVKTDPASAYFNPSLLYLKLPFGQSLWPMASLAEWYTQAVLTKAPFNESHWHDASFDALLNKALGTVNEHKANALWAQVQKQLYDTGGYIVWATDDRVDATSKKVNGITPSGAYNLGGPTGLTNAWLSS